VIAVINQKNNHRIYPYNYLTNVIFRIDFPKQLIVSWNNLKKEFEKEFPKNNQIIKQSVELQIKDFKHTTKQEKLTAWQFMNKNEEKKIVIDSESLTVEIYKYKGFDDLFNTIKFVLNIFEKYHNIEIINRLGLRYINQIEFKPPKKPLNWNGLINSNLTCVTDHIFNKKSLSRSLHFIEMNEKDYRLRFQFGMYNSEYPSTIVNKEFVLDYDCISVDKILPNQIENTTNKFHEIIYKLFEDSIDNKLREEMTDDNN
jgi:uncharacterized protein (TIGR04255 family)